MNIIRNHQNSIGNYLGPYITCFSVGVLVATRSLQAHPAAIMSPTPETLSPKLCLLVELLRLLAGRTLLGMSLACEDGARQGSSWAMCN